MRIKELFDDIKNSRLTNLDKITSLEKITDNYHPEKLKLLQKDLEAYINIMRRHAGMDVDAVFPECLYEAFIQSVQDNNTLHSISKQQFLRYLSDHGSDLKVNTGLLMLAAEIGVEKYGESYGHNLTEFIEIKMFEKIVVDKINEIETGQKVTDPLTINPTAAGRKPTYDIEDSERWFAELSRNPDYQHSNGTPNLGAIDAELVIRHKNRTGQKPSFTTIKNHRRELGFMQK